MWALKKINSFALFVNTNTCSSNICLKCHVLCAASKIKMALRIRRCAAHLLCYWKFKRGCLHPTTGVRRFIHRRETGACAPVQVYTCIYKSWSTVWTNTAILYIYYRPQPLEGTFEAYNLLAVYVNIKEDYHAVLFVGYFEFGNFLIPNPFYNLQFLIYIYFDLSKSKKKKTRASCASSRSIEIDWHEKFVFCKYVQ